VEVGFEKSEIDSPFARPMVLTRLGQFLMQINKENRKWINKKALPLVLLSERSNSYLVVGLSPTEVSLYGDLRAWFIINFSIYHRMLFLCQR
jgi:hypothetical protein